MRQLAGRGLATGLPPFETKTVRNSGQLVRCFTWVHCSFWKQSNSRTVTCVVFLPVPPLQCFVFGKCFWVRKNETLLTNQTTGRRHSDNTIMWENVSTDLVVTVSVWWPNIILFEDFPNVLRKNRPQKRVFREKLTLDTLCSCFRGVFQQYLVNGKFGTILAP